MLHPHQHPHEESAQCRLVILGDTATVTDDRMTNLHQAAAHAGGTIDGAHDFPVGACVSATSLTDVPGVSVAIGAALSSTAAVWVPFPMPDLAREAHIRALGLLLMRLGVGFYVGAYPEPWNPDDLSPSTFMIASVFQDVMSMERQVLAAAAATPLINEISAFLAEATS